MVVLEELEHALARGAKIYAEVTGYGATSDGSDMVAPSGEGGERAMRLALATDRQPQGRLHQRPRHLDAGRRHLRGARRSAGSSARSTCRTISSTKSLTGHSPGRDRRARGDLLPADAARRLHRRLGQRRRRSIPALRPGEIATSRIDDAGLDTVMSNSFGFGGTNAIARLQPLSWLTPRRGAGGLLAGKRALILGVANDHSIAWGIARAFAAQGRSSPSPTRARASGGG